MSDNKLNGWYWVTHGGETFPSQFTDGLSDIMDVNDDRIPAERLKVGPRIQEVQAFDPATVKVGDEVLVRAKVITIDKDDRTFPFYVELEGGDKVWFRPADIAGVIPSPEPPRRPDGWDADGKRFNPWHGVGADERDRRCEAARRAVEEAHRPKEEWRLLSFSGGDGVLACRGAEVWMLDEAPMKRDIYSYEQLAANKSRKPLAADEAYTLLKGLGGVGAEEFCKLTGYVPPKQCEGWRFTSAIGEGCYGFHASGRGFYCGCGAVWYDRPNPSTFDDAVGGKRHEITAAAAYEICRSNGQGAKFRGITGYKP